MATEASRETGAEDVDTDNNPHRRPFGRPQTPYDFNLLKSTKRDDVQPPLPTAAYALNFEPTPYYHPTYTLEQSPSLPSYGGASASPERVKRDSGLERSDTERKRDFLNEVDPAAFTPSLPTIIVQDEPITRPTSRSSRRTLKKKRKEPKSRLSEPVGLHRRIPSFHGLNMEIPTGGLEDITSYEHLQFSNTGSVMLDGDKLDRLIAAEGQKVEEEQMANGNGVALHSPDSRTGRNRLSAQMLQGTNDDGRVLSAEDTSLSIRVRSMYAHGDENVSDWLSPEPNGSASHGAQEDFETSNRKIVSSNPTEGTLHMPKHRQDQQNGRLRPVSTASAMTGVAAKEPYEVAGGIEDWEDVEGRDVDRYGFINPSRVLSEDSTHASQKPPAHPRMQRVSTSLQLIANNPRRQHTTKRVVSSGTPKSSRPSTRGKDARSLRTQSSLYSFRSSSSSVFSRRAFRSKSDKLMDEASDMLTLPPGLADIAEQEDSGRTAGLSMQKEMTREQKWRKMAHLNNRNGKGGGMSFDFDTRDPRLVSRTWKGIPDRWRATAWWSFLSASAKRRGVTHTSEQLITQFHDLQEESSADDVQIDVDVPRTISMHVMFRRRYRGGQRLLFRVLHAIGLYFPDVGYVQGMASLAATLLCYFDEENAFVMLVWLWELRGLATLYRSGFDGLMQALSDFEQDWLGNGDIAQKLQDLGITSTAYGTRWYLTLFNMSIPFPAQLRVWDVFMLLGDDVSALPASQSKKGAATAAMNGNGEVKLAGNAFQGADLDILHATSAALIDATREIIVDSDFENTMKVLTSWIPIRDEDLLMKVAKEEYKAKKKRTKG